MKLKPFFFLLNLKNTNFRTSHLNLCAALLKISPIVFFVCFFCFFYLLVSLREAFFPPFLFPQMAGKSLVSLSFIFFLTRPGPCRPLEFHADIFFAWTQRDGGIKDTEKPFRNHSSLESGTKPGRLRRPERGGEEERGRQLVP